MEQKYASQEQIRRFREELAERLQPAFVVEESSRRLVYVNDVIRRRLGDVTGQTCYKVFWNKDEPCAFCPERQKPGQSYQWECFDKQDKRAYKICTTWETVDQQLYRLSMAADASDIMELNRSVVDYLWLMQQLSELQIRILDDQSHILETVVKFLCQHFRAQQVGALRRGTQHTQCLLYKLGGEILPVSETLPPADQEETLTVLNETCTFYFYGIKNAAEWQESRTIILNVVKLYLENELLMRRIAWENEHDRATLLRNRAAFRRDCLTKYGALPELSIIFLDIDHLKEVNDTHGHDMGDRLICKAANVLLEIEDDSVCAYRMGGDEFVVACAFGREQAEELLGDHSEKTGREQPAYAHALHQHFQGPCLCKRGV